MDHIAILKRSWNLLDLILSGEKKVESRWYSQRRAPWDRVSKGDTVYLKDSGEPVTAKAGVAKVLQFSGLDSLKVKEILDNYGDSLGIPKRNRPKFLQRSKDKKYCILIFLESPEKIKPFNIDKKGFGLMAAWITTDDISKIKKI